MNHWARLESDLSPAPLFPVQAPDGLRNWAETPRQTVLFRDMRLLAPSVLGFAIPNAGKRNPVQARKEGIKAGCFDTEWHWDEDSAWIEMKGYSAAGRAGVLSDAQVDWGNAMWRRGKHVACFFDPLAAMEWLRSLGAPFVAAGALL